MGYVSELEAAADTTSEDDVDGNDEDISGQVQDCCSVRTLLSVTLSQQCTLSVQHLYKKRL